MAEQQVHRIWKPIEFTERWKQCDTSVLDNVSDAWRARRYELQKSSSAFKEFLEQLKREHIIETGVVERLYELSDGVTETMIMKGIFETPVSSVDTNIPVNQLHAHLRDQSDAVEFIFHAVDDPLTKGMAHQLHQFVTRHQTSTTAIDQFGTKHEIPLLKGRFKEAENNPRRLDGTIVSYCPPVQVESQIDELLRLYQQLLTDAVHPVIIAAWVHHAFSTIHPYQDGNGRVDRLLSSLVLIKAGLFPFTVRRRESKEQYITALEKADGGDPQPLVSYFCESQREYIQKALNFKEAPSGATLDEVAKVFSGKMEEWQSAKRKKREAVMSQARESLFKLSLEQVATIVDRLKTQINDGVRFEVQSSSPAEDKPYYYGQIIKYARKHDYYFNRSLPKGWINVVISLNHEKWYTLGFSIHHQGYDDGTLVIGAFLEDTTNNVTPQERVEAALPLDIRPVLISTTGDPQAKTSIISKFVEHALTVALAHISSEL